MAVELHQRMESISHSDLYMRNSYAERGIIALEFDRKGLWKYVKDPSTGRPFSSFTAWMECPSFLSSRRANFEAKSDMEKLQGIPHELLIGVPRRNIKMLVLLSSHIRRLEAFNAKKMSCKEFALHIQDTYPDQHIEVRKYLSFALPASEAEVVLDVIQWAMENDIAQSKNEALLYMAETAREAWSTTYGHGGDDE